MIRLTDLTVVRQQKRICRVEQLEAAQGERIAIVGPNGSGKTTLLRVLARLERDYVGDCRIDLDPTRVTYVHQQPYMFRGSTLDNAACGLAQQRGLAESWLEKLGLAELVNQTATTLSGGERRRVALARALTISPQLLLLDEPLADLDPAAIEQVCQVLNDLEGATLLIAAPMNLPPALKIDRTIALGAIEGKNE